MKHNCQICNLENKELKDDLWRLWIKGSPEGIVRSLAKKNIVLSRKDAQTHFQKHRPRQAANPHPLSSADALVLAKKLRPRPQAILQTLYRCPGLSAEQISNLFYLQESSHIAMRGALRDLKKLIDKDLIYRVFLDYLPGEGPRPRLDPPALFYLGVNARAYIQDQFNNSPVKKSEWLSETEDLASWNAPYRSWQKAEVAQNFYKKLDKEKLLRTSDFNGWQIEFFYQNWQTNIFLPLNDPLRQVKRFYADGIMAYWVRQGDKTATVPFFYYIDRETRSAKGMLQSLTSGGALFRSGAIKRAFPNLSIKTTPPIFCISSSHSRVLEIKEAARRYSFPEKIPILIIDQSSFEALQFSDNSWNSLLDGRKSSIPATILSVAGSSDLPAGEVIGQNAFVRDAQGLN